jgi:hypothetical protein
LKSQWVKLPHFIKSLPPWLSDRNACRRQSFKCWKPMARALAWLAGGCQRGSRNISFAKRVLVIPSTARLLGISVNPRIKCQSHSRLMVWSLQGLTAHRKSFRVRRGGLALAVSDQTRIPESRAKPTFLTLKLTVV